MTMPAASSEETAVAVPTDDDLLISASGHVPPDRLRLLQSLFGRVCQALRDRFFEIAGVPFEVTLEELDVMQVAQAGMSGPEWLVALCSVERQNTLSCIGLDAGAVNLVIEAFLGGGAQGRSAPPPRDWTSFDQLMAGHAAETLIGTMTEVFAPSVDFEMRMDEIRPADATKELSLEERPVLAARLTMQALGEDGTVIVVLPPGLFSSMRICAADLAGADGGPDKEENPWTQALDSQLKASEVICRAVLDGGEITLGDVARFHPGQILELDVRPEAPVRLECDGETLFHCDLGQAGGAFVLKLRRPASGEEEFLESVMGAKGTNGDE